MAYRSLRDFIAKLEAAGELVRVTEPVSSVLEMTEIQRIVSAYAEDGAEAVANALIRAVEAIRDPHQDNTTILAVRPLPQAV